MYKRYKVKALSRLRTPLHSDTIFGHLCWGIKYLFGEKRLLSFLEDMRSEPLIKISCGFPEGYVPKPVIPSMSRAELRELAREIGESDADNEQERLFRGLLRLKSIQKIAFVSVSAWNNLRTGLNERMLILALLADSDFKKRASNIPASEIHPHNTISRHTGIVLEEGGLYFESEWWTAPDSVFHLYVWFKEKEIQKLWDMVWKEYIEPTGFGKDKSIGAGHIQIYEDSSFDEKLFYVDGTNAWMNLSLLAFERFTSSDALYRPMVKFGKLGGDYAVSSPTGGDVNPFKKPMIMLEPGAVFRGEAPPQGILLKGVHRDSRICHYGYGLFLPFYFKTEN